MRIVHRHRHGHRGKALRIAISQDEITADLHYPGSRQTRQVLVGARRVGSR
ncbi:MAG: hypothetical protein JJE35_07905 [Thermoleophilia bacterium]|nr:hypothetical protein [Thermoleophilia bacterium]